MRHANKPQAAAALACAIASALAALAACSSLDDGPDFEVLDAAPDGRSSPDGGTPDDGGVTCDDPSKTSCDGQCVDTRTEAKHCGRCGHDCGGGECVEGECKAFALAKDLNDPHGLAVAHDALYATVYGDHTIVRVDKVTPGAAKVLTSSTSSPSCIGVQVDGAGDAVRLVWGEDRGTSSNVSVCGLPACDTITTVAASGDVERLVVVGGTAYWTESTSTSGKVRSCNVTDCANTAADVLADEPGAYGIAISGDALFVGRYETAGSVRKAALAGGTSTEFMAGLEDPVGIAADEKNVYATHTATGKGGIFFCPIAGCASANGEAFGPADNPHNVVSDGTRVYWNNGLANGGAVLSCPVSGCAAGVKTLAAPQENPYTIVVDDAAVYWTNYTSPGQVMKVAKP